jgi:hypothetical protein
MKFTSYNLVEDRNYCGLVCMRICLFFDLRLVCNGDVYGHLQALQEFLTLAGVYSNNNNDGGICKPSKNF